MRRCCETTRCGGGGRTAGGRCSVVPTRSSWHRRNVHARFLPGCMHAYLAGWLQPPRPAPHPRPPLPCTACPVLPCTAASVVIFDIHALQERFYFGDQVLPLFESGIPLLR